jgi:hypothetical protein
MRFIASVSTLLFLFGTVLPGAHAAEGAKVEGLQLPAWIQRGDSRFALRPGLELRQGDEVETGASGRLIVRSDDGSLIKLGINSRFAFDELGVPVAPDSVFSGVWRVLRGAFRFTTTALGADRRRDIRISVGTATVGIRGTDIWGKSDDEQDLVCLIEGQVEVSRGNDAPVPMTEPLSVYTAPRRGPANPLATVEIPQLQKWGAETELLEGQGVLREDGSYTVYLLSTQREPYAETMRGQFQLLGYPAEVTLHNVDDAGWYRVGVAGFVSVEDARAFAEQIEGVLGTKGAWVGRVK